MKRYFTLIILSLIAIEVIGQNNKEFVTISTGGEKDTIYNWNNTKISVIHHDTLYGVPQHISIIEMDRKDFKFSFVNHNGMKRTSDIATSNNEIIAINGTFYDMKYGNSVCYLQIDGKMQDTTRFEDFYPQINGAVKIKNGRLKIINWDPKKEKKFRRKASKSSRCNKKVSIMVAQPILIKNRKKGEISNNMPGFNDTKHNRSVLFTKKDKVYFLIIDGRRKGFAEGMTIRELQDFLIKLGAEQAINLDGGGSSTLWTKEHGIINYPSDKNGERNIANHIAVHCK